MQPETNGEIVAELRKISQLLALIYVKDTDNDASIEALDNLGWNSSEISQMLGSTASTVRGTLFRQRKKSKPAKKKK